MHFKLGLSGYDACYAALVRELTRKVNERKATLNGEL